jgi:hypothetical protein
MPPVRKLFALHLRCSRGTQARQPCVRLAQGIGLMFQRRRALAPCMQGRSQTAVRVGASGVHVRRRVGCASEHARRLSGLDHCMREGASKANGRALAANGALGTQPLEQQRVLPGRWDSRCMCAAARDAGRSTCGRMRACCEGRPARGWGPLRRDEAWTWINRRRIRSVRNGVPLASPAALTRWEQNDGGDTSKPEVRRGLQCTKPHQQHRGRKLDTTH